jgi:dihydroorotate dehydrogenase (fumarate)
MGDTFQVAYQVQEVGAAAIVMRSVFPEQMPSSSESTSIPALGVEDAAGSAEYQLSPEQYLRQVECLKKMLTIPVIASLNGHRPAGWADYARRLEAAGADAIELNCYQVVTDPSISADQVEMEILKTVGEIAGAVDIPLAVKLSPYHASVAQLAVALELAGATGLVVFNRFCQPDVNTAEITGQPGLELSDSSELRLRLRWLAILSPLLRGSLAAGGCVHTADDVDKALLTGAHAVQIVSVLLRHGPHVLSLLIEGLEAWMKHHHFSTIPEFRGSLNLHVYRDPSAVERASYIDALQSRTI